MTPTGIETATFQFVAQCLNCTTACPPYTVRQGNKIPEPLVTAKLCMLFSCVQQKV